MKQEKKAKRWYQAGLTLLAAALLLTADQVSKYFVLCFLKPVGTVTIIPRLLEFSYLENTGAAFGLFQGHMWFVVAVTLLASVLIGTALFRYRRHTFFSYAASALILAGGLGNLADRFFYGYVVDFIHVLFFGYIFNFADCCITVSAVLFIIHVLLGENREKKQKKTEEKRDEAQ